MKDFDPSLLLPNARRKRALVASCSALAIALGGNTDALQVAVAANKAPTHNAPALTRSVTPFALPAPSALISNVNILIVALDDVTGKMPVPPLPAPAALLPPPLTPPIAAPNPSPVPPSAVIPTLPGAITPASGWPQPTYRVNAKRRPARNPETFQAVPDNAVAYPPGQRPGSATSNSGRNAGANSNYPAGMSSLPVAGSDNGESVSLVQERPAGPAQAAAAPLRRALTHLGFKDVLNTAPDSAAIQRVLNNWRLTPHGLATLEDATSRLVATTLAMPEAGATNGTGSAASSGVAATLPERAPPTAAPSANAALEATLQPAILAAARVGQAMNYRAVVVLAVVPHTSTNATSALVVPLVTGANTAGSATTAPATGTGTIPALPSKPVLSEKTATYALILVDAIRETGEPLIFDESGANGLALDETAAGTAAALLEKRLRDWSPDVSGEKAHKVSVHMAAARTAANKGDFTTAEDEVVQVIALDGTQANEHVLLGDILQGRDPAGAAAAYRRAVELNTNDGLTWAKIAINSTQGPQPNWPDALKAGRQAIKMGYDTASVRTAMATAQFGRADIFRQHDRMDKAQEAEAEARTHLDRAMQLEPDNADVARLMARQLGSQGRFHEALQILDRLALQFPNDAALQTQYAHALTASGHRDEDAFAAWAQVWKLTGAQTVTLDTTQYRSLSEGFDRRLDDIGRSAVQLSNSVAQGAMPRETALLQLTKLREDMVTAEAAIKIIQSPSDRSLSLMHTSRTLAADLMDQALDAHQTYMETGQDLYRKRAIELHRQAINRINVARAAR